MIQIILLFLFIHKKCTLIHSIKVKWGNIIKTVVDLP